MCTTNKRNSTIEWLRIIAMFLIIFSHYGSHGMGLAHGEVLEGFNLYILRGLDLANIGVDLFVLIMGYFCINYASNIEHILRLYFKVLSYSVIILFFYTLYTQNFQLNLFFKCLFSVSIGFYWFPKPYLIIYLLCPFINIGLKSLTKQQMRDEISILLILFTILDLLPMINMYGNEMILQFFILYSIGAYIRIHCENQYIYSQKTRTILLIMSFMILEFVIIMSEFLFGKGNYFTTRNSIFIITTAVLLLICFINMKPYYNNIVNKIAGATFGVYLIHDNELIKNFIWNDIFKTRQFHDSRYMIIHFIITVLTIYIICTIIDLVKTKIIDKPINHIIHKIIYKKNSKILSKGE